jgi:hypothetical protein
LYHDCESRTDAGQDEHDQRRLNKYLLSKIWAFGCARPAAVFLGGFAGLSLTTTILPTVISILGVTDEFLGAP